MITLVVVAHPDDEVLGCGASIAKWSKSGDEVHVLIMAEGVTSRDIARNRVSKKKDLSNLARSAKRAAKLLSVQSVKILDFPDNRMDSENLLDLVKSVEKHVNKYNPEVIVTHHSGDLNIDHQITHEAVIVACRPQPLHPVKRILSFEVPSSTEWQSTTFGHAFVPNWFEDISETLELKIQAMKEYDTELRNWPHTRSIEALEHLARWRGASVGCEAAEAFMLVREIK